MIIVMTMRHIIYMSQVPVSFFQQKIIYQFPVSLTCPSKSHYNLKTQIYPPLVDYPPINQPLREGFFCTPSFIFHTVLPFYHDLIPKLA